MLSDAAASGLFQRRIRAWLAEGLDAYLALWAVDITFGSPVHPDPLRGKAAFADLVRVSLALVRPVRFDVLHLAVRADWVLAEWRSEVEVRADGRRIAWRGMSAPEIRDGLIRVWREYWNPADLAAAAAP